MKLVSSAVAAVLAAWPTGSFGYLSGTAQDPTDSENEIVVTGQRIPSARVVTRFVRNAATPVDGQLAVFRQPVCPEVHGMDATDGAKVISRMRTVAKVARVPMGGEGCDPNLILVVAADGSAFMRDVQRFRGNSLASLTSSQRAQLLGSPGPAWSWRTISKHTIDGKSNAVNDPGLLMGGGSRGGAMTGMQTRESSLTKLQVRRDVGFAYVVIDERALEGKSAVQIADYTLMRAVAGAQPPVDSAESGSILALFNAGAIVGSSLSYLDLAFLTTVYELPMDRPFRQQLTTISSRINNANTTRIAREALRTASDK